ncbi:MAG: hypothetical protein LC640_08935 [Frankia sp.]|nr:hypothetical protein [Frankia sp.]
MSKENDRVAVFLMPSKDLEKLIDEHRDHCMKSITACNEYMGKLQAKDEDVDKMWGTRVPAIREILESIIRSLKNRVVECGWYLEYLTGKDLPLTAAELVGFQLAFAPVVINVERALLSVQEAPKPMGQAERALASTIVQVPRLSLPDAVLS